MTRPFLPILLVLALVACGPDVPELDARVAAADTDYPELVPIGTLLEMADSLQPDGTNAEDDAASGPSLESRADALRRRAAALQRRDL